MRQQAGEKLSRRKFLEQTGTLAGIFALSQILPKDNQAAQEFRPLGEGTDAISVAELLYSSLKRRLEKQTVFPSSNFLKQTRINDFAYSQVVTAYLDMGPVNGSLPAWRQGLTSAVENFTNFQNAEIYPLLASMPRKFQDRNLVRDVYNDDNIWDMLDILRYVRQYQSADSPLLQTVAAVYDIIKDDTGSGDSCGVKLTHWKSQQPGETNHDKNTVSNAPLVTVALRLYGLTGRRDYLAQGETIMENLDRSGLLDRRDNLYMDHITPGCAIAREKYSYNQGTPIGAKVLLYKAAKEERYLHEAEQTARSALRFYNGGWQDRSITFMSIFYRNLLLLTNATEDSVLREAIHTSFRQYTSFLKTEIDGGTGGVVRQGKKVDIGQQASAASLFAMACWPNKLYDLLV